MVMFYEDSLLYVSSKSSALSLLVWRMLIVSGSYLCISMRSSWMLCRDMWNEMELPSVETFSKHDILS